MRIGKGWPATLPLLLVLLAACSGDTPAPTQLVGLKLAPAALGASIDLQQHLKIESEKRIDDMDAALEVDPEHVQLVGLAFGQRVFSLSYDGKELTSWRHAMLPAQVHAENVLEDMQLTLWPEAAIAKALPEGWRIEDKDLHRTLYMNDTPVTVIDYSGLPRWSGTATLENLRYHYKLTIQSVPASP